MSAGSQRVCLALALMSCVVALLPRAALAHGERNQEPFLRMRTVHWYDVAWSATRVPVNGELIITGRFRLFEDWPRSLPEPDTVFLGSGTPGPVFVRTASYINGTPMIQSTELVAGRDYEFRTVLRGRIPGRHHVHPMLNVRDAGPLLGPGAWVEVAGSADEFKLPASTLTGENIEDLQTWGLSTVLLWHGLWITAALLWMLWWVRRPLFAPRYAALKAGAEQELVTRLDRRVGAALLIATLVVVFAGYRWAQARYPRTIPLQAGRATVEPLPADAQRVRVKVLRAGYDVPGRSMRARLEVTNETPQAVQLGEFATANVRFVDWQLPAARAGVDPRYPRELIAKNGLVIDDRSPLAPGETRHLNIEMTDAAWEIERLIGLHNDPDSRFGALLFFYDSAGGRRLASISGPIVPSFLP